MAEILQDLRELRRRERQDYRGRAPIITEILRGHLENTAFVRSDKPWTQEEIDVPKKAFVTIAPYTHPKLSSNFWEHLLISSLYARKLAEITDGRYLLPLEAEAKALLHDTGRLVLPHRYLVNDIVGCQMLKKAGVRIEILEQVSSMFELLAIKDKHFDKLDDVPPVQRIFDLSDNLGKRNPNGSLFTLDQLLNYSIARASQHQQVWVSEARGRKALNEKGRLEIVQELLRSYARWLRSQFGIDLDLLREEVTGEFLKPENQNWLLEVQDAQAQRLKREFVFAGIL